MKLFLSFLLIVGINGKTCAQTRYGLTASGFTNQVRLSFGAEPGGTPRRLGGIENKPGFTVGGFAQRDLTPLFTTRNEVNYANMGFKSREPLYRRLTGASSHHYVQINQLVGVRAKHGFWLLTGLSLNLHMGSSSRAIRADMDSLGGYAITNTWVNSQGILSSPSGTVRNYGVSKSLTPGWQLMFGYTYRRLSVHVKRHWLLTPIGTWTADRTDPQAGRTNFFFSSWQYGLSYTLCQKDKP